VNLPLVLRDEAFRDDIIIVRGAIGDVKFNLCLSDVMSGALADSLVRRATEIAMKRDRISGSAPSGVTESDARQAVAKVASELQHLDWSNELLHKAGASAREYTIHKSQQVGIN
jgi:hypothetical protein